MRLSSAATALEQGQMSSFSWLWRMHSKAGLVCVTKVQRGTLRYFREARRLLCLQAQSHSLAQVPSKGLLCHRVASPFLFSSFLPLDHLTAFYIL